jgi:hypothetical protein
MKQVRAVFGPLFFVCVTAAVLSNPTALAAQSSGTACRLADGTIKHVIYIQFDNTHFRRDISQVPSDLEQIPHLLNFIQGNGTLLTNDHTVLISHTAGGILSSLTGVYPDRHGQTVSNSYVRTSSTGSFSFPSSFGYWTDPVSATGTPTVPNMITPSGDNAPAPWTPYTRAGCDVGAIATANIVLENTGTGPTGDITKVFGNPSPQQAAVDAARALPNTPDNAKAKAEPQADFVGFALHCAQGSSLCTNGQADTLPAEPNGYAGFQGLFGAQEINPLLTGQSAATPLTDLLGNPITDPFGNPGFPGFDGMSAAVSLAYVAAMQEKGIAVTFAYISDAHDFHGVAGNQHVAFGPGDAGYVQQLKAYDDAFAAFFTRLAADGINETNTLFVFTVDEGDHFVGVQKTNCDGVTMPCVYGANEVGEINTNIDTLVAEQFPSLKANFLDQGAPYAFTVHGDDAPPFYLAKKGAGGGPLSQTDPVTRDFERAMANLTAVNPYTGATDHLLVQMADQTEMKALHMFTTGDLARNATFVLFADPNYFITDFPASTCKTCINPLFAWNHGDIQPEIANTWLGFVGPGVKPLRTATAWTDHTDVRPTMLELLGLSDPYELDGRVVTEVLNTKAYAQTLAVHRETVERLGAVYKQLNAPFGAFGLHTLSASTRALAGDEATYTRLEGKIADLTSQRDALAAQIRTALNKAAFGGQPLNVQQANNWIDRAQRLLVQALWLGAVNNGHPS